MPDTQQEIVNRIGVLEEECEFLHEHLEMLIGVVRRHIEGE